MVQQKLYYTVPDFPLKELQPTQNLSKKDKKIVSSLRKAIKNNDSIEPIEVLMEGGKYKIKDGHHRFLAYQAEKVNPTVNIRYAEGGPINTTGPRATPQENTISGADAMMKARIAIDASMGNTGAQRMTQNYPQTFDFGNGEWGTHYMASEDNYAVPQIQSVNGNLQLGNYNSNSPEAMQFNSPEEADYFATHYKEVAPMTREQKFVGGLLNTGISTLGKVVGNVGASMIKNDKKAERFREGASHVGEIVGSAAGLTTDIITGNIPGAIGQGADLVGDIGGTIANYGSGNPNVVKAGNTLETIGQVGGVVSQFIPDSSNTQNIIDMPSNTLANGGSIPEDDEKKKKKAPRSLEEINKIMLSNSHANTGVTSRGGRGKGTPLTIEEVNLWDRKIGTPNGITFTTTVNNTGEGGNTPFLEISPTQRALLQSWTPPPPTPKKAAPVMPKMIPYVPLKTSDQITTDWQNPNAINNTADYLDNLQNSKGYQVPIDTNNNRIVTTQSVGDMMNIPSEPSTQQAPIYVAPSPKQKALGGYTNPISDEEFKKGLQEQFSKEVGRKLYTRYKEGNVEFAPELGHPSTWDTYTPVSFSGKNGKFTMRPPTPKYIAPEPQPIVAPTPKKLTLPPAQGKTFYFQNGAWTNEQGEAVPIEEIPESIRGRAYGGNLHRFEQGGYMPQGGNIPQLSEVNNGGLHEQNPLGGVPIGQNASVEQGEAIDNLNNFVFSNRIKVPGTNKTFADIAKKIKKKSSFRENDSIDQQFQKETLSELAEEQETVKQAQAAKLLQEAESLSPGITSQMAQSQQPPMPPQAMQPSQAMSAPMSQESAFAYGGRYPLHDGGYPHNHPHGETEGLYTNAQDMLNYDLSNSQYNMAYTPPNIDISGVPMPNDDTQPVLVPDDPRVGMAQKMFQDYTMSSNTRDPQTAHSERTPDLPKFGIETPDIKNPQIGGKQGTSIDYSPLATAMTFAPIAYNTIQGLRKADKLNVDDYLPDSSKGKINPYKVNVDPQVRTAEYASARSSDSLRNAAPNSAAYMANLTGIQNAEAGQIANIYANKENTDAQLKMQSDMFNAQRDSQTDSQAAQTKLMIEDWNAKAKAAKQNMLATAASQAAQMGTNVHNYQTIIGASNAMNPDYATYNYNPYQQFGQRGKDAVTNSIEYLKKKYINRTKNGNQSI